MSRTINGSNYLSSASGQYNLVPPFSMQAWVWLDSTGVRRGVMGKFGTEGTYFQWLEVNSATPRFWNGTGSSASAQALTAGTNISAGVWSHIMGVMEGSGSNQKHIYVNGTVTTGTGSNGNSSNGGTFYIGTDVAGAFVWLGRICEVAGWSRALSATEVAALAGGSSPLMHRTSLNFYEPVFGVASPENDYTGNAGNLTVTGTPTQNDHAPVRAVTPMPRGGGL